MNSGTCPSILWTLILLLVLPPPALRSQDVDTTGATEALEEFEASCDAVGHALWGRSLCGPIVLVYGPTRDAIANSADPDGAFGEEEGVWLGRLPDGIPLGNTAVEWGGMRWSMVLLPLPDERFSRLRLIAHEAFHRVQPQLGLEARDALSPHLDEAEGRLWLRLELRALAEALGSAEEGGSCFPREAEASGAPDAGEAGGDACRALSDALRFRSERYRIYPGADTLEAQLERHEGLAEYTGVRFALETTNEGNARVLRMLRDFETRPSFVRALGYGTGPALGLLLDGYMPEWRERAGEKTLAALLAEAVGVDPARSGGPPGSEAVEAAAARYGYAEIAREEEARAEAAAARLADIRARLLDGSVVRLRQSNLQASFNPNELLPVPEAGTYYPTGTFEARWGRLEVREGGALLADDWSALSVSAAGLQDEAIERMLEGGVTIDGPGWTLELAEGWTLRRAEGTRGWDVVAR